MSANNFFINNDLLVFLTLRNIRRKIVVFSSRLTCREIYGWHFSSPIDIISIVVIQRQFNVDLNYDDFRNETLFPCPVRRKLRRFVFGLTFFFGKVHTCQVKPFIIRLAAHKKPVFPKKTSVVDTDFILFRRFAKTFRDSWAGPDECSYELSWF